MKRTLLLIAILLTPLILFAQYAETIRTGRPGQSIGAYAVGSKVFQVQSGVAYNEYEDEVDFHTESYIISNVFRLGITEKLEISGLVNYRFEATDRETGTTYSEGVSNTQLGARYNLVEANGAVPAIGVQGRVLLRAQSEVYQREKLGSKFLLAVGNSITDRISYGTNVGVIWRGNGKGPEWLYTANLGFSLTDRLGSFVEVYGFLNEFTTNYDAGFSYLISEDFKVDISAGWQGNENIDDWFVDGGFSYRFDWR